MSNVDVDSKQPPPITETLPILYRDEHLVAVNKPSGLLVHRSPIDRHETRFALQLVRDQLDQYVYPIHRLDKPTSGLLLFALSSEAASRMGKQMGSNKIQKDYLAVVRGYPELAGTIEHAITEKYDKMIHGKKMPNKPAQPAITHFQRLASIELPIAIERYPQSRYALVQAQPVHGRKHQIRRHLKHIAHPIIGDAKHGKGVHNRYFQQHFDCQRLLLACTRWQFEHPMSQQSMSIDAPLSEDFFQLIERFGWQQAVPKPWRTNE